MSKNKKSGHFINGKNQIIDMLRVMPINEKKVLIENLKRRNPKAALEFSKESISINNLINLQREHFLLLSNHINFEIMGIALKNTSLDVQKRILSLLPKNYAEECFNTLFTPVEISKSEINKAKNKVIAIAIQLFGYQTIEC